MPSSVADHSHPQQWDVFWLSSPIIADGSGESEDDLWSEAQPSPSEHEKFSGAL